MKTDTLSEIVYRYLLLRIYFGTYPSKSKLPSIVSLCTSFNVSVTPVRAALKKLDEENFISLKRGRRSVVTFDIQKEIQQKHYLTFCHARKDAVKDLGIFQHVFLPAILLQGISNCSTEELQHLNKLVQQNDSKQDQAFFDFFYFIVQKLGNNLLNNFFIDAILFMHFINFNQYASNTKVTLKFSHDIQKSIQTIVALHKLKDYSTLKVFFTSTYETQIDYTQYLISKLPPLAIQPRTISYNWQIRYNHSNTVVPLALRLFEEITSSYTKEFLPPVALLSKQYSTSAISVRRAISLLNDFRITETINGKGTRIIYRTEMQPPQKIINSVNKHNILLLYLETLQFITITCRETTQLVFSGISEEALLKTSVLLQKDLVSVSLYTSLKNGLELVLASNTNSACKNVYGNLFKILLWPYSLTSNSLPNKHITSLVNAISEKNGSEFSIILEKIAWELFSAVKKELLILEIHKANQVATPQIFSKC